MAQQHAQTLPRLVFAQPTTTTSNAEVHKLFNNAKISFLATLTPQERDQFTACNSADQLLSDVQALGNIPKSRRGLPLMRRIKNFSDCLSPYFKTIEIICQSNPEWSCIAWGAFRLILELASNFATFFEKLSKLIERLTDSLPRYAELYDTLCSGPNNFSPRLSNSLVKFYVDILEFFQAVARVFSKPNGKLKRSPAVIADLLWRPFDLRFQDLLERMKFHQNVLKEEIEWASMKDLQAVMEAATKRAAHERMEARTHVKLSETTQARVTEVSLRAFRASIVAWLASPSFKDNFENAQDSRQEGTVEWLFNEPNYKAWESTSAGSVSGREDTVLWIRGLSYILSKCCNPGWGKTVAAASTIEELEAKRSACGGEPIVCYYFFNQQDPLQSSSTRLAAYRAIALQIFQKCHSMEEVHNIFALANDGSKSSTTENELRGLLEMIMPLLSDLYLVLDGLDECAGVAKLIDDIRHFCGKSSAKVILFSRPHIAPLRQFLMPEQIITMSRSVMSEDIHVFVRHQIEVLRDKNHFPSNAQLRSMEDTIVRQADGMFLWARLMMCYLDSPALTKSERMSTIFKTTPVGLQQMYDRILSQIAIMDDPSQQLASSVFTWIAFAKDDFTAEECSDAILPTTGAIDTSEKKDYVDNAVLVVCCGLIEKMQNKTLRFIHLTVKDHILSLSTRGRKTCILPKLEAHTEITTKCLSYLLFSIPAQPLSGKLSTRACGIELHSQYPLLPYAATNWVEHLKDGFMTLLDDGATPTGLEKLKGVLDLLEKFLCFPVNITVWIETSFLFNQGFRLCVMNTVADLIQRSSTASSDLNFSKASGEFSAFVSDLQNIQDDWDSTLRASPHEIWGDVSLWSQSRFLAQNRGMSIETLAPSRQDHPTKRTDPIFCISFNNGDCSFMGKLTIYPSSVFNTLWKTKPEFYDKNWHQLFCGNDVDRHKYCEGWFAIYDIYRLGEMSERVFSKIISLSTDQIALQMRYSFRLSPVRCWKLKFPLAISPDLNTIAILETITTIDACYLQNDAQQQHFSIVPHVDLLEHLQNLPSWEDDSHKLPYHYEWLFSSDSRFAIFRDWDMDKYSSSLVIFRLTRTSSGFESSLIKDQKFDGHMSEGLKICAIHPFEQRLMHFDNDKLTFLDLETGKEYYTNVSCSKLIAKFEFSQRGKFYVLHKVSGRPEIYPCPWEPQNTATPADQQSRGSHVAKRRRLQNSIQKLFGNTVSTLTAGLETIDSSSSIVDYQTNTVLGLCPSSDEGVQRIRLVSQEVDRDTISARTIITMPKSTNVRSVSTTLKTFDDDGRRLGIVLNPGTQSTYESDMPTISEHLPAVISRDTALPYPKSRNTDSALAHELSTSSDGEQQRRLQY